MGLLILFIILAAIFGIGGVIKGVFWAILIGAVVLLSALAVGILALPGAAWAHAVFTSSSSVPADSDQHLALDVPEEKGPNLHNSRVVVVVPGGFTVSG